MNDDIKSLPNGDFVVIPKKSSAPIAPPKKEPIRSRPKKS